MNTQIHIILFVILALSPSLYANTETKCTPTNNQNLITNGSFEDIELDDVEFGVRFTRTYNVPGWKVSGGPKAAVIANYPHSGNNFLQLATTAGYRISQTVKTQPGTHYLLRFWSKFHREQYHQFDLQFTNYPEEACGTPNNSVLQAEPNWHEHHYILCPETHKLTIEFSQINHDTGGGFGVALDTISLVPCSSARPTSETLEFLTQTWVNTYEEEEDEDTLVWRRAGSKTFPASRFRRTLSLYQDNQCQFLFLAPNDAHQRKRCQWSFDPAKNQLIIREPTGQLAGNYQLDSLTDDLLKISK